jgi:hypothetical protein
MKWRQKQHVTRSASADATGRYRSDDVLNGISEKHEDNNPHQPACRRSVPERPRGASNVRAISSSRSGDAPHLERIVPEPATTFQTLLTSRESLIQSHTVTASSFARFSGIQWVPLGMTSNTAFGIVSVSRSA